MKIKVFLERENETKEVDVEDIKDIFSKLDIDENTVLITRDNELLDKDEKLEDNDEIKLLSVISGG